jgi:hypothetical protein
MEWKRFFLGRLRELVRTVFDTRNYREAVRMIHKRLSFRCLQYNVMLSNHAVYNRLRVKSVLTFYQRNFAGRFVFDRWRTKARLSRAFRHLDVLAIFFLRRRYFLHWRGDKSRWLSSSVSTALTGFSKGLNKSIEKAGAAVASIASIGGAFTSAVSMWSPIKPSREPTDAGVRKSLNFLFSRQPALNVPTDEMNSPAIISPVAEGEREDDVSVEMIGSDGAGSRNKDTARNDGTSIVDRSAEGDQSNHVGTIPIDPTKQRDRADTANSFCIRHRREKSRIGIGIGMRRARVLRALVDASAKLNVDEIDEDA